MPEIGLARILRDDEGTTELMRWAWREASAEAGVRIVQTMGHSCGIPLGPCQRRPHLTEGPEAKE